MSVYLDSSACVKLFRRERFTENMADLIRGLQAESGQKMFASSLTALETSRALERDGVSPAQSMEFFAAIDQLAISGRVLEQARELQPFSLRTLDAIHLATALVVSAAMPIRFVTYDRQLAAAASAAKLEVLAPGL